MMAWKMILQEVRFVPDLKRNLISLGVLDQLGYCFKSENGNPRVTKGSMVVMKGVRMNGMFFLLGSTVIGSVSLVTKTDMAKTWHLRLGHVSERGMSILHK